MTRTKIPPLKTFEATVEAEGLEPIDYRIRGFVPGDAELEAASRAAKDNGWGIFTGPSRTITVREVHA
jgi:hypothetical protein